MPAILSAFFVDHPPPRGRAFTLGWLVLIYLAGLLGFGLFFNWGLDMPLFHDWADINVPRLLFLRDAIQTGQLPLHISDPDAMHGGITRYLTIPDTFLSPQVLLLARFSPLRFNLINVWLLYSLGFAGMLALRRRLRLSLFTFTAAWLLFNFNGSILAHYAVGHLTWGGYFLYPWLFFWVLRFLDGERSLRWTWWGSLLLLAVWLQGSFHQYIWALLFLGLCAISLPGAFSPFLRTILWTLALSAVRVLPGALLLGNYTAHFGNGFYTLSSVWDVLARPGSQLGPYPVPQGLNSAGGWEFTTYTGLAAALALVFFGVYRGLLHREAPFRVLALPMAGMLVLSFSQFYAWLRLLPIPLLQGERVVTRMLEIILTFVLFLAVERFQRWIEARGDAPALAGGALLFLVITFSEVWLDIQAWRVANIRTLFPPANFFAHKWTVANQYDDRLYLGLAAAGLAVSLLGILVLTLAAWRKNHRPAL